MRIGISVITQQGQNIWSNGLGQNVIFVAELFQQLPFVQSVLLIDCGDQGVMPKEVDLAAQGLRMMTAREATDEVDVIVEMGGALDIEWLDLMRARGKKVVYYCCGQPYVGLAEAPLFGKPGHAPRPDRCDEIWYLPKDAAFAPLLRAMHRCEAYQAPYIWHPQFVEARRREVAELGLHFGYAPRERQEPQARAGAAPVDGGLRVAIFEPNISVVKASSIPMLVCDEAYRVEPSSVQAMHVLNTLHLKEHPTMLYFANSLDLVRQHRAIFHGRHDIVGFMVQHADAVVSHQWHNDQNYSYLDALYGDYPLIHNSLWLRDAGYYYPGFDIRQGAAQLRRAFVEHDVRLADYRARSRRMFDAVDPSARHNLDDYAGLLMHLCRHAKFFHHGNRV